ncbi:MAG TPA: YcxB family protein [Gemmatimonadales bacterium]|nr:YcxB family protein [Gemmatimonadales bacterium]
MEYTLTFDPAEHQRAMETIGRILGQRRWMYLLAFGGPAIMSGLPILADKLNGHPVDWGNASLWSWVLLPALVFWGFPAVTRWQLRRMMANSPTLQGTLRRVLNDRGVEAHGVGAATTVEWSAVQRFEETPEFLLFFYSKNCAVYIPTRVVGDDLPKVRDYVAERRAAVRTTRAG